MRFSWFTEGMSNLIDKWFDWPHIKPGDKLIVFVENPHWRGFSSSVFLIGLYTRLQEVCALRSIKLCGLHSATIKKTSTGSGKAEKSEVVRWAREYTNNSSLADDNIADSIACGYTGLQFMKKGELK
jgi:Holliday junction resolvasome RuvABC endonuclease subunit